MTTNAPRLHRPKADTIEISDLLDDARKGKFELPDFQRSLAWREEDRIKLFDSIYRGFPIGDILLWEPEENRNGKCDFGPFVPKHRSTTPWLVVDGQQRLSTLFGCLLLDNEDARWDDWRFAFDTDKERLVRLPPSTPGPSWRSPGPELLPLTTAIDTARYLAWARRLPAERQEERLQAGDDFSKALRTYRVPFYVVRTGDRRLLQQVFERVNTSGKSLSGTDVFNALFPNTRLSDLARELDAQTGFGLVDVEWLLQSTKVIVGMDPAGRFASQLNREKDDFVEEFELESELLTEDDDRSIREKLEAVHPELLTASKRTIDLLQSMGIRRVEVLPYAILIPMLTHFFHQFRSRGLTDATLRKLTKFAWRISAGGATHWNRATFMRRVARIIRTVETPTRAVDALLDSVESHIVGDLVGHHDWRSGSTRLVALAMFELEPRELMGGAAIDVWSLIARARTGHDLFQRLWISGVDAYAASTANRIISASRNVQPGRLLEQRATVPGQGTLFSAEETTSGYVTEAYQSQGVLPEMLESLHVGHVRYVDRRTLHEGRVQFLELRTKWLTDIVDSFLERRQIERRQRTMP